MTTGAGVRFADVSLGYGRRPVVEGISLDIAPGTLLAVVGPNGGGKSTLLKAIAGQLKPFAGRIVLSGVARRRIAWLPQDAGVDRSFPLTIRDFVAMGAWHRFGAFGRVGRETERAIDGALAALGIAALADRTLDTVSGGQAQRALFARLTLADSPLILLDEPFAALDEATVADLLRLIRRWHEEGRTVVAVLHDFDVVRAHFPEALLIAGGIVARGPVSGVLTDSHMKLARSMAIVSDALHGRAAAE